MLGLALFAQSVEFFGDGAYSNFQCVRRIGERKRVENARFRVARIVTDPEPSSGAQRPDYMYVRGEHTKKKRIIECDGDYHVIRYGFTRQKLENAMLGRFGCCNKASNC